MTKPTEKRAEQVLRDIHQRRIEEDRDFDAAMMAPLRRAVAIAPNEVDAPVDLNDEIMPCEHTPSCSLTFLQLNQMRTSTFFIMKAWVPGWLWAITPHFAKPWLTKRVRGDLAH